jgi:hypothetical protein
MVVMDSPTGGEAGATVVKLSLGCLSAKKCYATLRQCYSHCFVHSPIEAAGALPATRCSSTHARWLAWRQHDDESLHSPTGQAACALVSTVI